MKEDFSTKEFKLPLVSVIITACNYGCFLKSTIASVLGQSYRDIECIVVDDGSTDDTPQIIAEAKAASPFLVSITNSTSLGQGAACRIGFEESNGQYIVFMDADDHLEPDFVRDHIFVNLSSRIHVGFTSSDIYQAVDGRIVLGTGEALNNYLLKASPHVSNAFRPLATLPRGPWPYDGPDLRILQDARYIPSGRTNWHWSPTTANMFRRDALTLLGAFDEIRLSIDDFLCTGVNVLCGSLLIDKALSFYRIHGENNASYQVQLTNIRTISLEESQRSRRCKELLIEHFTHNARDLCARLWNPEILLVALQALETDLGHSGPTSYLSRCLKRNWSALVSTVGEERFARWNAARMAASTKRSRWSKLFRRFGNPRRSKSDRKNT